MTSIPLFLSASMRHLESVSAGHLPQGTLMARAGRAVAQLAAQIASEHSGAFVVLVGPGNNGGDALVAAGALMTAGYAVQLVMLEDPTRLRGDAAHAWEMLGSDVAFARELPDDQTLRAAGVIIDGLFGLGLTRPVDGRAAAWIARINALGAPGAVPVLAIDIPSGLSSDTGMVLGVALRATHTLSLLAAKPGLYTGDGVDYCGTVAIDTLGIDGSAITTAGALNSPALFGPPPARRNNSNKGSFGNLAIIGGGAGTTGAALLAARMGLYGGAGRVYLALAASPAMTVDWLQPELMFRADLTGIKLDAAVVGCGLGDDDRAVSMLAAQLASAVPLVLDADALNLIAASEALKTQVLAHQGDRIMTPHPLEAARLAQCTVDEIQADRIAAALALASRYASIVILKGAGTVIAAPDGHWAVNPTGGPALATAGTGDVLAGLCGALIAQHWAPWRAALAAVWMHGSAADALVGRGTGPIGLTASEVTVAIRAEINRLPAPHARD